MVMAMPSTTGRTRVYQASSASVLSSASGSSSRVKRWSVWPSFESSRAWSFSRTSLRTAPDSDCCRRLCQSPMK